MQTVLQINSSIFSSSGQSTSTQLADELANALVAQRGESRHIVRDLDREPVPHLTAARFAALSSRPEERTAEQQAVVDESDELVNELQAADVIVLALPLYNFGVPSTLRAYFDHVARAKVTFRYTEQGPVGLLRGKKVYVVATRSGRYADTESDGSTAYVRQFLSFLGLDDVTFVYAEGLALGPAARETALAEARVTIAHLSTSRIERAA